MSRPRDPESSRAGREGRRQVAAATHLASGRTGRRPGPTSAQQIGCFFRSARESQNLSQEQLAALTDRQPARVSRAMISAVERGRHLPGLEVLLTLSQALHVSPNEVLEQLELGRGRTAAVEGLNLEQLEQQASRSFWGGDPRQAVSCYDGMLRLLQEDPPEDAEERRCRVATVELRRGAALRRCGATNAARGAIERAITLSDGTDEVQLQAYLVLVALLVQLGRLPLARDAAERALQLSEKVDDVKLRGWAWIEKGEVLAASDRHADARLAFLEARRCVRQAGDVPHAIKVEGNIGACLDKLGQFDKARQRYHAAVELARKHRIPASEAFWLIELGRTALRQGNLDPADSYARAALEIAKPREDLLTCFRAEWLRHRVRCMADADDRDRHRLAYLKKLYVRLEEHRGVDEIREFEKLYATRSTSKGGGVR